MAILTAKQIRDAQVEWVLTLATEVKKLVAEGMSETAAMDLVIKQAQLALAMKR